MSVKLNKSSKAVTRAQKAATQAQKAATGARKSATAAKKRQQIAAKNEQAARANLGKVRGQLNATRQQRETARRQLNGAQSDLNKANADVKNANIEVKNANAQVETANAQVATAQAQLADVRGELANVRNDLERARQDVRTAQSEARTAQTKAVSAGKSALSAGRAAIDSGRKVIEAEAKVATAEAKVTELSAQSEQLQRDNKELARVNESLGINIQKFRDTAIILSQSDVRVPVDSTLVEHSFARSTSAQDVRSELRAMFDQSATQVVPALLPNAKLELDDLSLGDGKRSLTTDEIYDSLVNFIADKPDAFSVRLVAARNHLAGESVLESRFLVLPIRPAFPADFELARVDLDGRSGQGPLFSALLDLVDEGTAVAKSKGVRPPLSPDVPNFYVPGSREQIFDTLREIKDINGPARVRLITNQPISTADQLSVQFDVEPLSTTTQANARLAPPR